LLRCGTGGILGDRLTVKVLRDPGGWVAAKQLALALTVYTGRGFKGQDFKIIDTKLSWSRVAVPEESLGADLLAVIAAFAPLLPFGPLNRFRKSAA
jgi:hypothetical protein